MKKLYYLCTVLVLLLVTSCTLTPSTGSNELDVEFKDLEVEYNGEIQTLTLEGEIPEKYEVIYTNNAQMNIGVYDVSAEVYEKATNTLVEKYEAKLKITGKLESQTFTYDGKRHGLSLNGEVAEGFEVEFRNNSGEDVGKYYVEGLLKKQGTTEVVDNYYGIMIIDYPKNEEFEVFMDEMFVALLEGDQMSINFLLKNPEEFGLEHYDAKLPVYSNDYSYEDDLASIKAIIDDLKKFENSNLSLEQRDTYEIVDRYLNYLYNIDENMNYMTNSYIGSYLGYQCNLPLELAEYKFRNEQDINDFISYLNHAEEAFKSYVEFAYDQVDYGYPMAEIVIDNVINSSKEFVDMGEDNFLIEIFNEKINNISFELVTYTKDEYISQAKTAILGSLTNAYQYLVDSLPALKAYSKQICGLGGYGPNGVEYYLHEMSNVLGFKEIDGDRLFEFILDKFSEVNNQLSQVVSKANRLGVNDYNKFYQAVILGKPNFDDRTFEAVLKYFQTVSKEIVPELSEMPNITIKNVPDALTDSFSPAAYFVSPIDETKEEVIYLNQAYINDYNYIYTTLAHEGYPGHLYQNVYTKSLDINNVRKVIKCNGYVEGWATYVEIIAYSFSKSYQSAEALRIASEYLALDNKFNLIVNALFDLCIHYKGMSLEELTNFLNQLLGGEYTEDNFAPAYDQICEIPTNMSMYAISYLVLDELKSYAEEELGRHFNIVEFNKVILDLGAAPLEMVVEDVYEYVQDFKFLNQ